MTLKPGSLPWLIVADLRIAVRESGFGRHRLALVLYGLFFVLLHVGSYVFLSALFTRADREALDETAAQVRLLLLSLEFFMAMAALVATFRLMLSGRELSLHLSAPLPFSRVLAMRIASLVAATWAVSVLLVAPVANTGALLGHPAFLLAYPVTIAMAALTVALALLLMTAAIRVAGLRRGRRLLALLQVALPLGFVFGRVADSAIDDAGGDSWALALFDLPARAASGEGVALLVLLALAAALLVIAARLAAPVVLQAVQAPDTAPALPASARRRPTASPMRFESGLLWLLLLKEWRTLLRDGRLAIALLAQPALIAVVLSGQLLRGEQALAVRVAITIFLCAQLAQYVAGLMINAEEAPVLLGSAPQTRTRLIAYKCIAALLPVLLLVLAVAGWLLATAPLAALVVLGCGLGAGFCACAIEVARPYPVSRRSFVPVTAGARRLRDPLDLASILAIQLGWSGAAWLLVEGRIGAGAVLLLVIVVPFLQWWRDANRQPLAGA